MNIPAYILLFSYSRLLSISWNPTNQTRLSINVSPNVTSSYSAIYTLNACPSNSVNTSVTVNPIPVVSFEASILEGCSPLAVDLSNSSPNANLSTLTEWTIDNNSTFVGDDVSAVFNAGCHDVMLSMTVNGCVGSATYNDFVCAESIPTATFSTSVSSFTESTESIVLNNLSTGATSYIWNMGDGSFYTTTNVSHVYSETSIGQTIWLFAYSSLGCVDSASISIPYEDPVVFYIPNSFTPDGDEFNNSFAPIFTSGIDFYSFEMSIYNRWGELIYFSKDASEAWEGTYGNYGLDVQEGTYTYVISFKTPQKDDIQIITGHINLLR